MFDTCLKISLFTCNDGMLILLPKGADDAELANHDFPASAREGKLFI